VLGYNAKGYTRSVAIGSDAQANGLCSVAIGSNCINSSNYCIKFWVGASTTVSDLVGVDFGNVIFDISDNELTITNATSFDIRPTLASELSAPTNNNDIITKEYVDTVVSSIDLSDYATKDELPDLSNCITKSNMFFEGDPTKDIRIKYNSTPADSYNHENNIYIGGSFTNSSTITYDSQNSCSEK
jgi:hypothetical protein